MKSMTGFASRQGTVEISSGAAPGSGVAWRWELRAVNARGRDLRLRLPDPVAVMEPAIRAVIEARIARGAVTLSLRLDDSAQSVPAVLDRRTLAATLDALGEIRLAAEARGLACADFSPAEVLSLRGVLAVPGAGHSPGPGENGDKTLHDTLLADLAALLEAFDTMRAREGAALSTVLDAQLDRIVALVTAARALLDQRADAIAAAHRAALGRLARDLPQDTDRIAQELAQMAVRLDVAEELDRLDAHCAAARALIAETAPSGRRLDFLCQEFNREANTLCAKAQYLDLTRIGLDLKAVIDQMREQIQNVE